MNQKITPNPIIFFIVAFLGIFTVLPGIALSQEKAATMQWSVNAEKITRFDDPTSIIAEGNVVLKKNKIVEAVKEKQQQSEWEDLLGPDNKQPSAEPDEVETETVKTTVTMTTIKADWLVYDVSLSSAKAKGNISIDMGSDVLQAEEAVIDLKRETGTFQNATIIAEHKDIHLAGKVIEKTGPKTYLIEDGWVITCKLEEGQAPPWSFGSAEAEITDDGYAILKHATFRVKDVPVMYSPYVLLPVKRTRQTGFLFPSVSLSERDGFGLSAPLFVNLSPSSDLTYYPYFLSNRGLMNGLEYRYVLNEGDKGVLMANHLHDSLTDPAEEEYYEEGGFTHTNKDRYWLRGKVDQDYGKWVTRLDMDIVSDSDYLTEFNSESIGFKPSNKAFFKIFGRGFQNKTARLRNNTFRFIRSWDGLALQGEFLAVNDVRPTKTDPSPLWKMPSLDFSGLMPVADSGIDLSWTADYVNFWRESGIGGHRVDIAPKLTTALPVSDYLETSMAVGLRSTSYLVKEYGGAEWQEGDSKNRLVGDFQIETATTMIRDFPISGDPDEMWSHTLRPFVSYNYLPYDDDEVYPYFDSMDRVNEKNMIIYGVDNFFKVNKLQGASLRERELGYIKIHQGYDLREEQEDKPFTPINIELGYTPTSQFTFLLKSDFDTYDDGFIYHSLESTYLNSRGDNFSVDYLYRDGEARVNTLINHGASAAHSIKGEAKVFLYGGLAAGYAIERDIEHDKTLEEDIALIYQASCWSVQLISHKTPGDNKILLLFQLANLGNPVDIDLPGI